LTRWVGEDGTTHTKSTRTRKMKTPRIMDFVGLYRGGSVTDVFGTSVS
jgi:hypothetical protein